MSGLSMMESRLPPGFRFHPRDDELVCDYLEMKINPRGGDGVRSFTTSSIFMIDVNLNHCEPWDLPEIACVGGKAWYFFSLRDRKYATGQRTNRATQSGYWKATGKDRPVMRKGVLVGMRKTLVFYQGRAPKGKKTDWIMHEFRAESNATADPPKVFVKEDWVLCRVLLKHRNMAPTPAPVTFNSFQSHAGSSSSSLPPLTDSTHITVDRAHGDYCQISMNLQEFGQELQVPCFSNSLQGPMSAMVHQPAPQPQPARHFPSDAGPRLTRPLVNSERNMIKVVLSQFAKLEEGQRREASTNLEDGVVESYFSTEGGLENIW